MPLFMTALFLLCATLWSGTAFAARWQFTESILDQEPLAHNRSNDLRLGDVNGDGRLDIWLSGRDGPGLQSAWYLNPGDRSRWRRLPFLEGSWKYGALGDLDGDGDMDVVAGFSTDDRVYWVENGGSPEEGGWRKHFIGLTGMPDQVLARDLNNDGRLEVVAVYKGGPIHILRRPPDPTAPWPAFTLAEDAAGLAGASIGDLDGDGDLDVVFGNAWFENPLPEGDWSTVDWTRRAIDPDWPEEARSVVADIDGDGRNDVVLSGEESDAGIAWYRNPGPGPVGEWRKTMINAEPYEGVHSLAVADFDRDGKPDIFAAEMHTSPSRRVTVFEQGAGPEEWIEHVIATVGSHNARAADLDGDGRIDIAGKNFTGDMRPRVWFNDFDPDRAALDRWRRHLIERDLPHLAAFVLAGDLSGDGLPDIAAGAWWWPNPGAPDGAWRRQPIGGELRNAAVLYDLDGDGDLDIVGTDGEPSGDAFFWAENDGEGGFTVHPIEARADGDFLQGAEAGRLLDDSRVQIVLSWHNGQRTDPVKGTQWFRVPADPHDEWIWERIHAFSNEEQIDVGDIDGDGRLDVHLGTDWLRNEGDGRFTRHAAVTLAEGEVDRVRLADVDGDGDLDVVIGAEDARRLVWGEHPGGDGRGEWREHLIAADFLHMSVDVADLDGDGHPDVVSGEHKGRGRVTVYENVDGGRAWHRHIVDPGRAPPDDGGLVARALSLIGWTEPGLVIDHHNGTRLVDLDGDGDLDIVSLGWQHRTVIVYENRTAPAGEHRADAAGTD